MSEKNYRFKVVTDKETFRLIKDDCRKEFLNNNPDFEKFISDGYLTRRMVNYFLKKF